MNIRITQITRKIDNLCVKQETLTKSVKDQLPTTIAEEALRFASVSQGKEHEKCKQRQPAKFERIKGKEKSRVEQSTREISEENIKKWVMNCYIGH